MAGPIKQPLTRQRGLANSQRAATREQTRPFDSDLLNFKHRFGTLAREVAFGKLKAMVDGAAIVRKELS